MATCTQEGFCKSRAFHRVPKAQLNLLKQALTCFNYQMVHEGTLPCLQCHLYEEECMKKCKDMECGSQLCYKDYLHFYLSDILKTPACFGSKKV